MCPYMYVDYHVPLLYFYLLCPMSSLVGYVFTSPQPRAILGSIFLYVRFLLVSLMLFELNPCFLLLGWCSNHADQRLKQN